jgi:hypothetical protein
MKMCKRKGVLEHIERNKKRAKRNKKAQEEMAGFAIILVIVAVILLVFLRYSLRNSEKKAVENYEVDNFLQSVIQQTTRCMMGGEYLDVQDLIFECELEQQCDNNLNSCETLESTLRDMVVRSWRVGEDEPYKGYNMSLFVNGQISKLGTIADGETTANSYGSEQIFPPKTGDEIIMRFELFYEN